MTDITAKINLNQLVRGIGGKPTRDLLDLMAPTEDDIKAADDLNLGRLMSWIFLEGIPSDNIKDVKKVIDWSDKIESAMKDGKLEVDEGDISQIEELLGKVKNPAMQVGRNIGSVVRALVEAKEKILLEKQKQKKKP